MFSHVMLGSDDIAVSKQFYDALFEVIGADHQGTDEKGRLYYVKGQQIFLVTLPINGEAASGANGGTIGWALPNEEAVNQWHRAGIKGGGTAIESPPGIRKLGDRELYLAYLRDPFGNKLCGLYSKA
ncbi:VOC family protein [Rosenbergiella australiborealis]|uniref:VOC family protein n=1 Tax=Rosenbergiella australiborealis TaxID=1544696 RepID=A0ABS5T558_9GAMM|nr:VOC family protein [Rosenbergiella australiborealis]MBT0727495.1 VOC family protein [Rosenbergiella australiborealis]